MTDPRVVTLTPSQRAVVRQLLADGARNKVIARRMYLTEHTIKSHMRAILAATGAADRTMLVVALHHRRVVIDGLDVP